MNNDPFTPEPSTPPQQFGPQPEAPQQPAQQPVAQFEQSQPQPQFVQQPQQPVAQPPVGPGKSKKGLIIGLVVGVVVIAAGVTAFMLMQGSDKSSTGDSASSSKNGSSSQTTGDKSKADDKKVTAGSNDTITLVRDLASKVSGVSGTMVVIPNSTPDTIEVAVVIDAEPLSSTTLNGLLAAIANGAGISDVTKAKLSFMKDDGTVASGANLPLVIERMKIGTSVVGTAGDSSATFDISKMRELLS